MSETSSEERPEPKKITRRQFILGETVLGLLGLAAWRLRSLKPTPTDEPVVENLPPVPTPVPTQEKFSVPTAPPESTAPPVVAEGSPPSAEEIKYPELKFDVGRNYTFNHPNFSFDLEMTTKANFNNAGYSHQRGYEVAYFEGCSKAVTVWAREVTVINVHSGFVGKGELPGTKLVKEGNLVAGDRATMADKESGDSIALEYLGKTAPIPSTQFEDDFSGKSIEVATTGENAPARLAREEGRNLVLFVACSPPFRNGKSENKIVSAFSPVNK